MFILLCVKKHSQTVYIHMKLAANTKIFFHVQSLISNGPPFFS